MWLLLVWHGDAAPQVHQTLLQQRITVVYFSFLQEHPQPSQLEIEKIIDGNICRCTGYRPILDTLKQFAADTSGKTQSLLQDIEDLTECRRSGGKCAGVCQSRSSCHGRSSSAWHQPASLTDLLQILAGFSPDTKYRSRYQLSGASLMIIILCNQAGGWQHWYWGL